MESGSRAVFVGRSIEHENNKHRRPRNEMTRATAAAAAADAAMR